MGGRLTFPCIFFAPFEPHTANSNTKTIFNFYNVGTGTYSLQGRIVVPIFVSVLLHSFNESFYKYFLSIYSVSRTVLGTGDTGINKIDHPCSCIAYILTEGDR